ncbi:MAG: hypothetical protein U9Q88_20445 [Bacillota bacterium]|uniref:hypothetical protein n=1 Tax=Bacillus sp. RO2 TaxID=2723913 RepID=UPI00145C76E9|nr:hypothetical protein [Bacillus sp. RO2]MEA3322373.1 hypothetical protein [Bacillota bacterium]NMH73296.1 hypothetical protein [Bacillus sp. RO2]
MRNVLIILFIALCSIFPAGCGTEIEGGQTKAEDQAPILPTSGDYSFRRYIEEKGHTDYRVLYSQVPNSEIVEVRTVIDLESAESSSDISETSNFYEETKDGIYGYIVLSEEFPSEWDAKDIKKFPKTKIIAYPLEASHSWTEEMEDFDLKITYHIREVDAEIKTPAKTFKDCIIIDFEEKDKDGNTLRKGNSAFAPNVGWIRHEVEAEVLKDVHKLIKINEG